MILEVDFILENAQYLYLAGSVRHDILEPFTVTITVRLRPLHNLYSPAERHLKMHFNPLDRSALENIVWVDADTYLTIQEISQCPRIVIDALQQDCLIVHDNACFYQVIYSLD